MRRPVHKELLLSALWPWRSLIPSNTSACIRPIAHVRDAANRVLCLMCDICFAVDFQDIPNLFHQRYGIGFVDLHNVVSLHL